MIKRRFFKELFKTVAFMFILALVINYIRSPKTYDTIPKLELITITGEKIDLRDSKNRPTVIHFWATWCPICKMEATNFNSLIDENINLITIAVKSEDLVKFINIKGLKYRVVDDINGELAKKFNIEVFPTTLIYDSKGILKFTEVGYTTTLGLKARLQMVN